MCCRPRGNFTTLRLGAPILLGDKAKVKKVADELKISLDGIRVINPAESEDLDNFARRFGALGRDQGIKNTESRKAMLQPNYFGAMMVAMHQADGMVTGTNIATTAVLRPLIQTIRPAPGISTVAGCTMMEFENAMIGEDGVLFLLIALWCPIPRWKSSRTLQCPPRGLRAPLRFPTARCFAFLRDRPGQKYAATRHG